MASGYSTTSAEDEATNKPLQSAPRRWAFMTSALRPPGPTASSDGAGGACRTGLTPRPQPRPPKGRGGPATCDPAARAFARPSPPSQFTARPLKIHRAMVRLFAPVLPPAAHAKPETPLHSGAVVLTYGNGFTVRALP